MVTRIRLLQLAIAAINLLIFVLAFTSIWPFPNGDFKVDLPTSNEVRWEYREGVVHVTAPYSVDNGGFYDVDELVIRYSVTNVTGYSIASDVIDVGALPAGRVTSGVLVVSIDLVSLYEEGILWMVFNDDLLNFAIEVSCYYTMKLLKFDAAYSVSVPWDALVSDARIEDVVPDEDGAGLTVHYRLATSSILSGLSAQVTVTYYDDGVPVGQALHTITLGREHYSVHIGFSGPVVPDSGDSLVLQLSVQGLVVEQEVGL